MNPQPEATEADIAACRAFAAGYAAAKEEARAASLAGPPPTAAKAAGGAILVAVAVSLAYVIAAWRRGDDVMFAMVGVAASWSVFLFVSGIVVFGLFLLLS